MKVTLTPEHEKLIKKKIASGEYKSAGEIIRRALRLLEHQDRLEEMELDELRKEVAIGLDDLRAGRSRVFNAGELRQFAEEIKREGRRRLASKRRKRA